MLKIFIKHLLRKLQIIFGNSNISSTIDLIIELVGIKEYAEKQAKTYSGGNKRKLSVGIAMLGFPKVLILGKISKINKTFYKKLR